MASLFGIDTTRLHAIAAETRLRAVESQLPLGFTFCAIAETELRFGRLNEVTKVVTKLRHHAEIIRLHIDEPGHLPTAAIPTLNDQLIALKERTDKIEALLRRQR